MMLRQPVQAVLLLLFGCLALSTATVTGHEHHRRHESTSRGNSAFLRRRAARALGGGEDAYAAWQYHARSADVVRRAPQSGPSAVPILCSGASEQAVGSACVCAAGHGRSASAECVPCGTLFRATGTGGVCGPCVTGRNEVGGLCSCPAGTAPDQSGVCSACTENTIGTGGACTSCPGGTIPNAARTGCIPCSANLYSNGEICSPCPAGQTSLASSAACSKCEAGSSSTAGGACTPCTGNSFSTAGGLCQSCPVGQLVNAGRTGCSSCPVNTYYSGTACVACPAGSTAPAGVALPLSCLPCPAGSAVINGICSPCPTGTIAPSASSTSCSACPTGLNPDESRTTCQVCIAGASPDSQGVCHCGGGDGTSGFYNGSCQRCSFLLREDGAPSPPGSAAYSEQPCGPCFRLGGSMRPGTLYLNPGPACVDTSLVNGGFESGLASWQIKSGSANVALTPLSRTGANAAIFNAPLSDPTLFCQTTVLDIAPGHHTLSFWAMADHPQPPPKGTFVVSINQGGTNLYTSVDVIGAVSYRSVGYTQFPNFVVFVPALGPVEVCFTLSNIGYTYIDDVRFS